MMATFCACKMLEFLKLGTVVKSLRVPGGGRPTWFFVKKPYTSADDDLLNAFGYSSDSTPTVDCYKSELAADTFVPKRAPNLCDFRWPIISANSLYIIFLFIHVAFLRKQADVRRLLNIELLQAFF